jgi:hypothetical protein
MANQDGGFERLMAALDEIARKLDDKSDGVSAQLEGVQRELSKAVAATFAMGAIVVCGIVAALIVMR